MGGAPWAQEGDAPRGGGLSPPFKGGWKALCLTTRILIDTDNFFNNDDVMTSLLKSYQYLSKLV